MTTRKARPPWVMRLTPGLRDQPSQCFIGAMIGLVGLTFVTGFTQSAVSKAVGPVGLHIWGALLMLSGFGVVFATLSVRPALEKLTLRILSVSLLVYVGWLMTVVDWRRAVFNLFFGLMISGVCEIRIAVLKRLYRSVSATGGNP